MVDPKKIQGVVVTVECGHCKSKGRVPGGKYQHEGEVVNCPVCNGQKVTREAIPLSLLYDLLMGNLPPAAETGDEVKLPAKGGGDK
jgi:NAD-dependent SIR2 family protein deacetylase